MATHSLKKVHTTTRCKQTFLFLLSLLFPSEQEKEKFLVKKINKLSLSSHTHTHIHALYGIHKHRG
ncbi:Uncharacterized protein APZ42_011531 [Daphnia magna]|uniref:Uncharacterized protein n=1 Tax=Daphnia magna TaxID=35525 RepID=A0A162CZD3_9CRUS|nr:Uncharacterized protein APZ42_011531 [Daphnia magna]